MPNNSSVHLQPLWQPGDRVPVPTANGYSILMVVVLVHATGDVVLRPVSGAALEHKGAA